MENIKQTTTTLGLSSWIDSFRARFDIERMDISLPCGLYKVGTPNRDSQVFVTSNYRLSFDALRSSLSSLADPGAFILVLETYGINVWCAAGKGTFGTEELIRRIEATNLSSFLNHRTLILPQLGATGVNGFEVKKRTGFTVRWGPVKASDLPKFISSSSEQGTVAYTHPMHRVKFPLHDRLVLVPIEIKQSLLPYLIASVCLMVFAGKLSAFSLLLSFLSAFILFPIFLPILPSRYFSVKGLLLGTMISVLQVFFVFKNEWNIGKSTFDLICWNIILVITPFISGFAALVFTGSTTFASKSETMKETAFWLSIFPKIKERMKKFYKSERTLQIDKSKCIGCKTCATVCPHGVIDMVEEVIDEKTGKKKVIAKISRIDSCMECGACAKNCPVEAVTVESGVGCAYALILSAITGSDKVICGCDGPSDTPTSTSTAAQKQCSQSCCGSTKNKCC